MAVVLARREAAGNHLAPEHPDQRLAEQLSGDRVGLANQALAVDHHHPAGQQIEQALQALGEQLLFRQFLHALGADQFQLTSELIDARLQRSIGIAELFGHLLEQGVGLLQLVRDEGLARQSGIGAGAVGSWLHVHLSLDDRQRTVVVREE